MDFFKSFLNFVKNLNKYVKLALYVLFIILIVTLSTVIWYNSSLKAVSKNGEKFIISIDMGSSSNTIAKILANNHVIKNELAFKLYLKINKIDGLQAGQYTFNTSMNVPEIVSYLKTGKIMKEQISITFIEGKNMKWFAKKIAEVTYNTEKDVFDLLKDNEYIDTLIDKYWFLTDDIKNKNIYYPLEGYLFPDTYSFEGKDVSIQEIFNALLDNMALKLDEYTDYFKGNKLRVHEVLTLASIIELEGTNLDARKNIASVFYNRLNSNMSLGSDVTTYYAFNVDIGERDLTYKELYTYNPYNTRGPEMQGKLPIGPIDNPSLSSIDAVINPNKTNYLYFVADKNNDVYFSKTLSEHENIISKLKQQGLWFEY